MKIAHMPETGPRYWAGLMAASVFGANMGDFFSHNLHLGHVAGLPPLALLLAVILLAERRVTTGGEAFYWLAIVTLRTAATNLGDLLTHDLKLGFPLAMSMMALLLAGILLFSRLVARLVPARRAPEQEAARLRGMPATDLFYWAAMLTAGTLGTDIGDYVADMLGLGVGGGTILLGAALAALLALRGIGGLTATWFYWLTIVAVRSAGTTAGDWTAGRHGLALGLPLSTALTGAALLVLLLVWRPGAPGRAALAAGQ